MYRGFILMEVNVIDWHSKIASDFEFRYKHDKRFTERYQVLTSVFSKYSCPSNLVLDVGCGTGTFSFFLANVNDYIIGIDPSYEMLKICHSKKDEVVCKNISFLNSDLNSLEKLIKKKVDLIICSSVLEYLDDLDHSLSILASLLNTNGFLIFTLPNRLSFYRIVEPLSYKIIKRPEYQKYIKNVRALSDISRVINTFNLKFLESVYFERTPLLSSIFRKIGLSKFSENVFVCVAKKV